MQHLLATLLLFIGLARPTTAFAQQAGPELQLRVTRDFGYGGFNNEIEGRFSYRVTGPENLIRVDFYLDDNLIATVDAEPFNYQFHTGDFAPGAHRLYAIGHTADGVQLRSNEIVRRFLSSEEAGARTIGLVAPILAVAALVGLLSYVLPSLFNRGRRPATADYGIAGEAVCGRCGKPFARKVWMPNLLVGKLAHCPHCGKTALARRATPAQLAAAEALLNGESEAGKATRRAESDAERRRFQIDESRYEK